MSQSQANSIIAAACTGVALGLAAYLLYRSSAFQAKFFNDKRRKDKKHTTSDKNSANDYHVGENSNSDSKSNASACADVFTTDGFTTIKLNVPKEMVGVIIGRQGCNIKQIQADTKTKIDFGKQEEGPERSITIRGSEKGAHDAELKILHIVYGQKAKESYTLEVPHASLGFIIGKGGETINKIQMDSHCHVKVNSSDGNRSDPDAVATVKLTGTESEIQAAAAMVKEQVEVWQAKKLKSARQKESSHFRQSHSGRGRLPHDLSVIKKGSPLSCEVWPDTLEYLDCYVTAIEDPSHIWVQVLSQDSAKLEEINAQLCSLYSDPNQFVDDVVADRPPIGTIVAVRNLPENLWYRGKITAYSDENEPTVDIYFVDYGDSSWVSLENHNIQLLRPEFYSLRAQAVECYTDLVYISACPEKFTEEQCELFERLTHTGSWKRIVGAAIGWKAQSINVELAVVKLVDTNTDVDIFITDEIMKAVKAEKEKLKGNSSSPRDDPPDTNDHLSSTPDSVGQQANNISSNGDVGADAHDLDLNEFNFQSSLEDNPEEEDDWD